MYIATRNFKHSGNFCKVGDIYKGNDIEFLLKEKLIEQKLQKPKIEEVVKAEEIIKALVKKRGRKPKKIEEEL